MTRQITKQWENNLRDYGLRQDLIERYVLYIAKIVSNNCPVIFDFDHLSLLLGRSRSYLASAINSSGNHYRSFSIAKRRGGTRIIDAPYPALMECQNWIYNKILKKKEIHRSAHAFTPNHSIISNAQLHLNQHSFLKVDLKDFFPSIEIGRVITVFRRLGYSKRVSYFLAALCCKDGKLPQGAPTSPSLSNIIAISMDKRLNGLAQKFGLTYSRYADDLAFSGDRISLKTLSFITDIIEDSGFQVNPDKTRLVREKRKRILTGISIADESLKIPRDYKRRLRQEVHYILKFGAISHIQKKKIKNPYYVESMIGKLQFWLAVEPGNRTAIKYLEELKILSNELQK